MPNDPTRPPRNLIDRVLDVGVFAPLGMLLERDRIMGELVAAGRKQVEFSRSLGRVALRTIASRGPQAIAQNVSAAPAGQPASTLPSPAKAPPWASRYSAMSAREILAVIENASPEDCRWVRETELGGKNRVTVLRAVDGRPN